MKVTRVVFTLALLGMSWSAWAQTAKPGLWEINNKIISGSPEMEKAMADMHKQLASMPPEQRKMMEDMMAKQGVGMGTGSTPGSMALKVCLTKEMVERNHFATQQGDCQHTQSPRTGNVMKFSFVCTKPPSSGEGQVTFNGSESYTMQMTTTSTARGKPEKMSMEANARFLTSDCGNVKPLGVPAK
jgi:hypothetical protein